MSLTIKEHPQSFLPVPTGSYIARCYALIDLGMQYSKFYNVTLPKVIIGWELTNKLMDDGKPMIHLQRYTASLHEKASLRALLETWSGQSFTPDALEGFELKKYLGATGYLTIRQTLNPHTGQYLSKVLAICPLPPPLVCPPPMNKPIYFNLDEYSERDYLAVPEGIRKHIHLHTIKVPTRDTKPLPTSHNTLTYHPLDSDEPQPDVDL